MKKKLNILYIGESSPNSTSAHRAHALQRLGHNIELLNPYPLVPKTFFLNKFHYRTGYQFIQNKIQSWLKDILIKFNDKDFNLIWINNGELLGIGSLQILKQRNIPILLYNNDDPSGGRDGNRFNLLLKAIPYYDLCVVMRNVNIPEYKTLGAKDVKRAMMSYDEIIHKPFDFIEQIPDKFRSEVAFIGTWMRYEKRDEFLLFLIENEIQIAIWGDRWEKSPYWKKIKPYYRGAALGGKDYVAAIQGAKICLGMLSKKNRDLHTRRSLEIPFIGGLFCAERTSEHTEMYIENEEAVFWQDAQECALQCKKLLSDDNLREKIRIAGMKKVRELKVGNEDICSKILETIDINQNMAIPYL